jgi:hypothetical protein
MNLLIFLTFSMVLIIFIGIIVVIVNKDKIINDIVVNITKTITGTITGTINDDINNNLNNNLNNNNDKLINDIKLFQS